MNRNIITIGREFGSGGRLIGKKLAKELGIPYYDKEIITMTAKKSGFSEEVIAKAEQVKTKSLLYSLHITSQELPLNDQIFIVQTNIIREISQEGPCVIVGRCADYVLRENPNCLRTFIHAPMDQRLRRVEHEYGIQQKNLESYIRREDKKRSAYYGHFTQQRWGDLKNYHLSIDSGLGLEQVVAIISQLAKGGPA